MHLSDIDLSLRGVDALTRPARMRHLRCLPERARRSGRLGVAQGAARRLPNGALFLWARGLACARLRAIHCDKNARQPRWSR